MNRSALLLVIGFALLASVSAIDAPSSKPKQSVGNYVKLFLKPSKAEKDVDAYAFVLPVRSVSMSLATKDTILQSNV